MQTSLKEKMLAMHPSVVKTDLFKIEMNMPTDYPAIEARPTEEGVCSLDAK